MTRAALYMRVSTLDQHPETQLYDLRQMAQQRGYEIVEQYEDRISGAKARRPGLDGLMRDARRGRFDVVLVWACDRIARSTKHFLEVLDELSHLNTEFVSFREQIDTSGPAGPGGSRHHRRHRRVGAQLDRRAGAGRHAEGQARRPAHRTEAARSRSCRHLSRSLPGPEPPPDRTLLSHLNRNCTTRAPRARPNRGVTKALGKRAN
jgi:hypothetical protein